MRTPTRVLLAAGLAGVALAGGITAAAGGIANAAQVFAGDSSVRPAEFGFVSLVEGQAAQLNVANVGDATCTLSVGFVGMDGIALGGPDTKTVAPGEGVAIIIIGGREEIGVGNPDTRQTLRPVVEQLGTGRDREGRCVPVPTLEVFDTATGATSFMLPESYPEPIYGAEQ